ncbi:SixA phosphatase family protein [Candidatus Reidiella endopervernicosa]|uniref:Histidine phosphatase family protein n=1 Tax=Candidatus Reidiella endopervernicosa TaxID=2738883 RepID=A0A6N0HWP3_9GAMM|nr:histidine phosphatase family protein [Candidatus Reidiella endopervernicosa]QKQ26825.1 histidine phosphatase family protein [Candidatus Reidiella endopervernicosa]
MEELLLLRHGKSDWRVSSSDFNRPLKKRGRRGATRIGQWLRDHDLIPDLIIASPAVRADATARRCAAAMGLKTSVVVNDGRLYLADLNTLLDRGVAIFAKVCFGHQAQANSKTSRDRLCLRRPDRPAYVA